MMKSKRHYAPFLAIAVAIGFATFVSENNAHAQLFPRLRARLEPLLQPQPLPNPAVQPNPAAVQPQPRAQTPLRPVQPIVRPRTITPPVTSRPAATPSGGSLGVDVEQMNVAMQGLRVTRISAHSRADDAGLREGDMIVAIDGQETPTIQSVVAVLSQRRAGESVVARVIRGRQIGQLTIPLVEKSISDNPVASAKPATSQPERRQPKVASNPTEPAKSVLVPNEPAVSVPADTPSSVASSSVASSSVASDSMLKRLGIAVEDAQVVRGAVVTEIQSESVGERLGFQISDRIVSVDGEFVFTAQRFESRLQQWDADKPLKLQLIRDERLLTLSLDPASTLGGDTVAKSTGGKPGEASGNPGDGGGDAGSMLEGVGAALGNFLAGQKKQTSDAASGKTSSAPTAKSLTPPDPVAKAAAAMDADPLAFGDEEAIDQAAFEELATPKVAPVERAFDTDPLTRRRSETKSKADSPSNEMLELPAGKVSAAPSGDVTSKRGKELEAEIERLERQLEEMKAKAAEKK
ncbi:hypothetical protein GCM10023156_69060 [Novipirellula rosea]|uniref:PDZ domain-containing protein n=2 Tax=Novipirellula rosea TaxID=1031540 RepID=A0ABP8NWP2_9BACT